MGIFGSDAVKESSPGVWWIDSEIYGAREPSLRWHFEPAFDAAAIQLAERMRIVGWKCTEVSLRYGSDLAPFLASLSEADRRSYERGTHLPDIRSDAPSAESFIGRMQSEFGSTIYLHFTPLGVQNSLRSHHSSTEMGVVVTNAQTAHPCRYAVQHLDGRKEDAQQLANAIARSYFF